MNASFELQDLGFVLGTAQQDPTFFNLDFLQYTGIVPATWELERQPTRNNAIAQVNFVNGITLIAEPTQTLFLEAANDKTLEDMESPNVALRYSEIMKNMAYRDLVINFRGFISFPDAPEAAHRYFFESLMAPGAWQQLGSSPVRGGLNLLYTFDQKRLNLTIQEAAVRRFDEASVAALVFSGSCENGIDLTTVPNPLATVQGLIRNWQVDLKLFVDVVAKFVTSS
jgi:hypothetical protein